jgi:hypothetical protein
MTGNGSTAAHNPALTDLAVNNPALGNGTSPESLSPQIRGKTQHSQRVSYLKPVITVKGRAASYNARSLVQRSGRGAK